MPINSKQLEVIEQFVVLMYDITSPCTTVNQCRRHLFTQRGRSVDACPPTKDALELHIRRATLQSHIWTHATYLEERDANITEWG